MLLGGCYNSRFKVFDDFNRCDISGLVIVDFPFTCELRFSWTLRIWDWFLDILSIMLQDLKSCLISKKNVVWTIDQVIYGLQGFSFNLFSYNKDCIN